MILREQEEKLFKEWEKKYGVESVVRDGVVSVEDYKSSGMKILFILKEVNDEGGGGWDLRHFIRKGARSQTWNTITRWIKGIRDLEREIDWEEISKIKEHDRTETLRSIAAMNLKKVPGGGSSKKEDIKEFAQNNRDLINTQYELYNPDITICCGTGTIVKTTLDVCSGIDWKETSRAITYGSYGEDKHIFRFYHPQARYPGHFKYYMLIDAIKEVIK